MKYSEKEEDDINNRLSKMDKKLYYLLNPETERMRARHVPYQLSSPYDLQAVFERPLD